MSSKHNPGKVTLGMIRDKPITKSVPIIRYHASDHEVTADDGKGYTAESESLSSKYSPSRGGRGCKDQCESIDDLEDAIERQFVTIDENLSEGAAPSDPWRVLSELRGKITKTFEEKLSEMKSDRKKWKRRSRENSSVSDSEDVGDVTPTDESAAHDQHQQSDATVPALIGRDNPGRFVGFSQVRTGLKAKSSEDDSVESGVEAAESTTDVFDDNEYLPANSKLRKDREDDRSQCATSHGTRELLNRSTMRALASNIHGGQPVTVFAQLRDRVFRETLRRLGILFLAHLCSYYVISLPDYFLGLITGILVAVTLQHATKQIYSILSRPPSENPSSDRIMPVIEIPAAEEHAVVERFEGWLNELPYAYDPDNYHVARTRSVYFRLEGDVLHVMETKLRIPKRTVWDEPKHKLKFTRRRKYKLAGAKVELLPEGLVKRRRWSKKYPICVTFKEGAVIETTILNDLSEGEEEEIRTADSMTNQRVFDETGEDEDCGETTVDEARHRRRREVFEDCLESNDDGDDDNIDNNGGHDVDSDCHGDNDDDVDDNGGDDNDGDDDDDDDDDDGDDDDDDNDNHDDDDDNDSNEDDDGNNKRRRPRYKMFVFARADRQKEDWYRRLAFAANHSRKGNCITTLSDTAVSMSSLLVQQNGYDSKPVDLHNSSVNGNANFNVNLNDSATELAYNAYMARYLDTRRTGDTSGGKDGSWVNCLIGRILFDMHKCPDTVALIQDKIQRKLSNIKLPYFMESLLVTEVTIGQGAPLFENVRDAVVDERGLWLELDVTYKGCLTMTVETKLNLMKLTRAGSVHGSANDGVALEISKPTRSPIFDSDVEDSPETSTEDDDGSAVQLSTTPKELASSQSSGRKFLNMVDKLAASKYFQHATELSYVRRALEGVSNTEIRLMVNVSGVEGRLSVNVPPSPSDRLWYGFRPVPKIALTVKPALGERAVNIVYVTKWIETKLLREFEKIVVLPNMDDIVIPLCPNYPYVS